VRDRDARFDENHDITSNCWRNHISYTVFWTRCLCVAQMSYKDIQWGRREASSMKYNRSVRDYALIHQEHRRSSWHHATRSTHHVDASPCVNSICSEPVDLLSAYTLFTKAELTDCYGRVPKVDEPY
jgi:hypothetical protein